MQNLPWNRQEIFHDEMDRYPHTDYFPLTKPSTGEEEQNIVLATTDEPYE